MAVERVRAAGLGQLGVVTERRGDGTLLMRSAEALGSIPASLTSRLMHWAGRAPERTFIAERDADGGWRRITYGEARSAVLRIAASLLTRDLSAERPILILSGNSIRHALLALAAMHVGIPYAPISTAYSLVSTDFGKLRHIVAKLTPGLVFAEDFGAYARAIAAAVPAGIEIVAGYSGSEIKATSFDSLMETGNFEAVDVSHARVGPDTIAKFLFTSGSTGVPKGVINTQRMLCSNQAMLAQWLQFLVDEPPVLLDWLPWNHTFGSNHNFGLVLWNGGTLHIDDGRPLPDAIEATVRNLREVSPTIYFNVPKGYEMLLPHLERDAALRQSYLRQLRFNFYSGATLAPHIAAGLDRVALSERGRTVLMVTAYGATETAPAALVPTEATAGLGVVGLPLPGITVKLIPENGKLEARLTGPTITPGYWREPALSAAAFDDEGFYRMGDALRFARDGDPGGGLVFDGRLAEDFKLATGTWVHAAQVRLAALTALAPLARDIVLAGHDRDWLSVLIFPDLDACRALAPDVPMPDILASQAVRDAFRHRLAGLAPQATGSSTRIERAIVLAEPPSIDAGEITDKGSLNQRAVLERRAAVVTDLYADPSPPSVIAAE